MNLFEQSLTTLSDDALFEVLSDIHNRLDQPITPYMKEQANKGQAVLREMEKRSEAKKKQLEETADEL